MNCRKKSRKWWRSRNQGIVISNCLKQFANSKNSSPTTQKSSLTQKTVRQRHQRVRQLRKTVRQRKETAQEVKQRKEFVKAKRAIYKLITSNPKVTTAQIADKLNVSTRQVQKYLKRLIEQNLIVKEGSRINGSWKILDEEYTDFFGRI